MLDSDSDSDVILIDSDDDDRSSRPTKIAIAPKSVTLQSEMDGAAGRKDGSSFLSSASALSVAQQGNLPVQKNADDSVVDVDAYIDLESDTHVENSSSSSSSSSSGIPSPFRKKVSASASTLSYGRPPLIIHTKSPSAADTAPKASGKAKPAKKKVLTNYNKTIRKEDEISCTDKSATSKKRDLRSTAAKEPSEQSSETIPPAKQQRKPRKRQWGYSKKRALASKSTNTDNAIHNDSSSLSIPSTVKTKSATNNDETANKHFHCYLLRSLDPDHPLKTYIGFTTHPQRRIRQHNGILKAGGARRTKRSGRPWTFVCVIHGFQDKITALQFEWAWQNVDKSLAFREAVGDDQLAKKMKRRYGPKNRLEELRILLKECLPFCLYSLTIYFPEKKYHDIFSGILRRGKNGNPYKKDDDESEAYDPLMDIEVCALENMPVAKEAAALKEKKKAKQEAGKVQKKKTTDYASDISDWMENAKSMVEAESCWSILDEDDEDVDDEDSKHSNLKMIAENSSSVDLCDSSKDDDDDDNGLVALTMPLEGSAEPYQSNDVDDISKDFLSLSIDVSKRDLRTKKRTEPEECDFSTISSTDSLSQCSLDYDPGDNSPRSFEKENQQENHQTLFGNESHSYSMKDKTGNVRTKCDIVDLCDSP